MFCSLVARAFRRALCGAPSRRGSGDSYQELTAPPALQDDDQRREVNIDVTEQNARYQTVDETTPLKPQISIEDLVLLEKMGTGPVCTGRFLTVHKRRRKKLTTRSLNQNHAILDDIQHGQVQWILDRCGMWAFNAFALENAAGGRSLPVLCVHLFHWYGLLDHFHLDVVRIWKLFTLIEEGYHSTNPYHNSIHATDVTQAMHCFLQEEKIRKHVTPLEVMASLIGAVAHDLDHPGVNQHFLISTSNHLAILYQNSSVLENHHWRSAVGCLLESGVAEQLLPYRAELELQIRDLILATDINRQQEFLTTFKEYLDTKTLRVENKTDRHFILQIALKCADISNPTRPWDISHKWSLKVCDEFFRQGEFERQLNLPITSICDQQSTSVAKIQVGFFRFVVTPLYQEWHRFLQSSLSAYLMEMLEVNRKKWEKQEAMEQAEETHTELSDAEVEPELTEDEVTKENSDTVTTITDFVTPPQREIRRQSLAVPTLEGILDMRRHSMPLHIEQRLPCNLVARRESVPGRQSESPVRSISRGSSSAREDHGFVKNDSQMSIVSSESPHYSSACEEERPLSAENLLPETSITSITSNVAARRIATLIRGGTGAPVTKALTRQQTFPPPQPYVRMRYMSATAEMSACKESVYEDSKSDTSHNSSQENISPTAVPQYPIPSIAVLSPNNNRPVDMLTPSSPEQQTASAVKTNGNKRDQEISADKNCKMVKLSENSQHHEKENVDPTKLMSGVSLIHRRGSAPVTITLAHQEEAPSAGGGLCTFEAHFLRRSSVPFEITCYHVEEDDQMEDATTTTTSDTCPLLPSERRGSAPTDIFVSRSFADRCGTEQLTRHTSLNGKSASSRRKKLHRRSSGGPETVCLQPEGGEAAASSGLRLLRRSDNPDTLLLAQRRGSLPIEVLTVGHSVF